MNQTEDSVTATSHFNFSSQIQAHDASSVFAGRNHDIANAIVHQDIIPPWCSIQITSRLAPASFSDSHIKEQTGCIDRTGG